MQPYERLLAKSARGPILGQTIRKHTSEVMKTAEALVVATGADQLRALDLPASWHDRLRRETKLAALLHDLGKANGHFQRMVQDGGRRDRPQGLRHEAVSFLIARLPEMRDWIRPAAGDPRTLELVLWAIAGHHRKFPPEAAPDGCGASMDVYLNHVDFLRAMDLGSADRELGLGPPPPFPADHPLGTIRLTVIDGIFEVFSEARREAGRVMATLTQQERRYVAALKATLICADVAGSIGRRGAMPMSGWIDEAFRRVPAVEDLRRIVAMRLGPGKTPYPFQSAVADRSERVVFARAGCGSGKTLAAYLWAARQAPGRRLFFCYPTTGTATEGYRDYLADPSLDADLIHARAEVDKAMLSAMVRSGVEADMKPASLGDDEADRDEAGGPPDRHGGAAEDSAGALEQWSTPLVSCTVDTVLGLVQNNRRGLYAWPSIAGSAIVFDEVHAYDDRLFAALLRFLSDVPGVSCLLMTASLPDDRLRRLRETLRGAQGLDPVGGPPELEGVPRYRRVVAPVEDAWRRARHVHDSGGKILWVVNTVDAAISLAESDDGREIGALIYHSRFRYVDRVKRHGEVIDAFHAERNSGPALAVTTQVAEMSLDLSADLLVTELAPIPALIQRLGRLNRRARPDGKSRIRPFIVLERTDPRDVLPYTRERLDEARRWLDMLGPGEISQADLVARWVELIGESPHPAPGGSSADDAHHMWLDGGFITEPGVLRESSPGIDVILPEDQARVEDRADSTRPEEVRIPMPPPPGNMDWRAWPEVAFTKVPPAGCVAYDARKGARWVR